MKQRLVFIIMLITASLAWAQKPSNAKVTWDLGASAGTYGGESYSEVNLGVNWFLQDYLIWRNSGFARFPQETESIAGLDTSLRFQQYGSSENGDFGVGFFAGPGYRFSKTEYSALFGEAGVLLKARGLSIGGGAKYFSYNNPGHDIAGRDLPKSDTVYFLILSGGGAF